MRKWNEVIVQFKQSIKIESALQFPLAFFYGLGERNILQTALLPFSPVFFILFYFFAILSMPSKVIIMFEHKYVLGLTARVKMTLLRLNFSLPFGFNTRN